MSEIQDKYRLAFLGNREVLADLLGMCHFGSTLNPDNKAQIAEYNVGVAILAKLGIFGPGMLGDIINALCGVSPKKGEKDEKDFDVLGDGLNTGGDAWSELGRE